MGKRSRKKARQAGEKQPPRRQREALRAETQAVAVGSVEAAIDPAFPPGDAIGKLLGVFNTDHFPEQIFGIIADGCPAERLRELAEAGLRAAQDSAGAHSFAAQAAEFDGRAEVCVQHLKRAARLSEDPQIRRCLAATLIDHGRLAEAIPVVERLCREDPTEFSFLDLQADLLCVAEESVGMMQESEPCPCGSGRPYGGCCLEVEDAVLRRFIDREPFDVMRQQVFEYSMRPELPALPR